MKKLVVCLMIGLGWMSFSYAGGNAEAGQGKAAVCGGCHGVDGNSMIPSFPKLAGQPCNLLAGQPAIHINTQLNNLEKYQHAQLLIHIRMHIIIRIIIIYRHKKLKLPKYLIIIRFL